MPTRLSEPGKRDEFEGTVYLSFTKSTGARARRRPTCSAIIAPWLKPTSARRESRRGRGGRAPRRGTRRSRAARRRRGASAPPRRAGSSGAALLKANHCRPIGEAGSVGRVRRDERRLGGERAPLAGRARSDPRRPAVAVQENHEVLAGPRLGSRRGPVNFAGMRGSEDLRCSRGLARTRRARQSYWPTTPARCLTPR